MARQTCLRVVTIAVMALFAGSVAAYARQAGDAGKQAASAAAEAAKASPELVTALSKEIGGTPEQAAGAAGALFGLAKSRLKADEFSQIANVVPGMETLLKAAPALGGSGGSGGAVSSIAGAATGLASMATAFTKLGLKPEMVSKAIPVLTSFVSKGGANLGSLLGSVLK